VNRWTLCSANNDEFAREVGVLKRIAILSTVPLALVLMAGALCQGKLSLEKLVSAAAASETSARVTDGGKSANWAGDVDVGKSSVVSPISPPLTNKSPPLGHPDFGSHLEALPERELPTNLDSRTGKATGIPTPPTGPIDIKNPGGAQHRPD
jgi:hypothetical protein